VKHHHSSRAGGTSVGHNFLEFVRRERMRRGTPHQCFGPRLQPREFLDVAERADAVEEEVALQERRIGGVDQRIGGAVEERPAALLFQRFVPAT